MGEHSLRIKEWTGTGTPDLTVEWKAAVTGVKATGRGQLAKLIITRKSDTHSSRFAMMASLNKKSNSLSWGFLEATFISDMPSMDANVLTRTVTVFSEVAVADFAYIGGNEETITLYANKKSSDFTFPIGVP